MFFGIQYRQPGVGPCYAAKSTCRIQPRPRAAASSTNHVRSRRCRDRSLLNCSDSLRHCVANDPGGQRRSKVFFQLCGIHPENGPPKLFTVFRTDCFFLVGLYEGRYSTEICGRKCRLAGPEQRACHPERIFPRQPRRPVTPSSVPPVRRAPPLPRSLPSESRAAPQREHTTGALHRC